MQTPPDSVQDIIERSEIRQISNSVIVNTIIPEEQCAQNIISVSEEQCAQNIISVSEEQCAQTRVSVSVNTEIPEEKCAQHIVHFIDAQDQSDSGSLTTQAPQSSSIRATINSLSTWISAVQPRESWYLAGWIKDSPIDFLVDPGAVVSADADAGAIHTPLKRMHMELEAANKYRI